MDSIPAPAAENSLAESSTSALGLGFVHGLAGETRIMTWDGLRSLAETAGMTQRVVTRSGHWVEVPILGVGVSALQRITLSRFRTAKVLFATGGHRWLVVPPGASRSRDERERTTAELRAGDRLAWRLPRRRNQRVIPSPFGVAHGIVVGDGAQATTGGTYVDLWGDKRELLRFFPLAAQTTSKATPRGVPGVRVRNLPGAFKVLPGLDESPGYLYGWLAGYFAADGHVSKAGQISLASVRRDVLEFVALVCARLGVGTYPVGRKNMTSAFARSPYCYELPLLGETLTPVFFCLNKHRERFEASTYTRNGLGWKVIAVDNTDRIAEVYSAIVPPDGGFALEDHVLVPSDGLSLAI